MSGAADGELAWQSIVILVAAVAVPPLAVVWHEMSGATTSGPVLLGATVVPLGALAVGLGAIAHQAEERGALEPPDDD